MAQNCGSGIDQRVIRVLLMEPMSLLRDALTAVLSAEDDLDVVAALEGLDQVVAVAPVVRPDVAVLDVKPVAPLAGPPPPDQDVTVVRFLGQELPTCVILLVTGCGDANRLRRALASGAPRVPVAGIVDKDNSPSQLISFIRRAARGERVVDPRLTGMLAAGRNPLTEREQEILCSAASGLPVAEVAAKLGLSPVTVRTYLSTIIRKTGARNRTEAVRIAGRAGWL